MAKAFKHMLLCWLCLLPQVVFADKDVAGQEHTRLTTNEAINDGGQEQSKPPFFGDHARGWHWYEHIPLPKKETAPKEVTSKESVLKDNLNDPSVVIERYRKLIARAQDRAIVDPSPQNLSIYMALQQDSMARSHLFAREWQRLLLHKPELDDTLKFPTAQGARHVAYAQEKQITAAQIRALKETHGLYFFFRENCPYCHAFAPIVKTFAEKYGWAVFAISLDGGSLSTFPKARQDNGFASRLGVNSVPALFVANPGAGKILALAHGMISESDIESRILLLTQGGKR